MGGESGDTVHEMMRKKALKAVTDHLNYVREGIQGYKEGLAELWQNEYVGKSVSGAKCLIKQSQPNVTLEVCASIIVRCPGATILAIGKALII